MIINGLKKNFLDNTERFLLLWNVFPLTGLYSPLLSCPAGSSVSVPRWVGGGALRPATEHHSCGHSCHGCWFLRGPQVGGTT